jgi:hypothetical protein
MTPQLTARTVEGEPLALLAEALTKFDLRPAPGGGVSVEVHLEPRLGHPFARALMRAEARLMLEVADQIGRTAQEPRTDEQRAIDALIELVTSVSSAFSAADGPPRTADRTVGRDGKGSDVC